MGERPRLSRLKAPKASTHQRRLASENRLRTRPAGPLTPGGAARRSLAMPQMVIAMARVGRRAPRRQPGAAARAWEPIPRVDFVATPAYLGSMGRDQAARGVGAWLGLVVCLAAVAWTRGNDWFVDVLFGASLVYLIVHLLRSRPTQSNP
jgi:hypothetical protein